LLGKADRTAYIQSQASDFQSRKESDFSEVTRIHSRYVNRTLLSKAIINISTVLWHTSRAVTRGRIARRYEQLQS